MEGRIRRRDDLRYQASVGNIWDDFDAKDRDHAFTRPTINGVIDSRQWEGFREGIDDVRYVTTLLKAIQAAKATKPEVSEKAQIWLNQLDPQSEPDEFRKRVIAWILALQQ